MRVRLTSCLSALIALLSVAPPAGAQATQPAPPTDLLTGAKWAYSTDGGKTFSASPPAIKAETTVKVQARTEFTVAEPAGFVVLELTHGLPVRSRHKPKLVLNGNEVKGPMEGMYYKTIPAIDAKLLKKGKNVLTAEVTIKNVSRRRRKAKDIQFKVAMRLAALKPHHLKIQTGPILGAFGKDYFTVTCRTNMPAEVSLWCIRLATTQVTPGAPSVKSQKGLIHRLRIKVKVPTTRPATYLLHAVNASDRRYSTGSHVQSPIHPRKGGLRFVAMGDSRSYPKDWASVAEAVLKVKPDLVVFSGDMVSRGRNDWEWDEHFVANARKLLAAVPFYAVIGNHEENAPLFPHLFYTPGKDGLAKNWSQTINGVHLIGIDGGEDWSAKSENARWLEKTLADSKAKFIFFFTHYPAWTSAGHGRLDAKTGRPRERAVRQGQDTLVPLLVKHKATALICGHDHVYERSELPGGLTHIISGGAGAPRYKKSKDAAKQNPYSKVFASTLHYCLFEIEGETCTMKVVTPAGKTIDTRTWKAVARSRQSVAGN